jgi:hypothetical protein
MPANDTIKDAGVGVLALNARSWPYLLHGLAPGRNIVGTTSIFAGGGKDLVTPVLLHLPASHQL